MLWDGKLKSYFLPLDIKCSQNPKINSRKPYTDLPTRHSMTPSATLQTIAAAYLDALASFSPEKMSAIFSDGYQHTIAPTTLVTGFGLSAEPWGRDAFIPAAARYQALFSDWSIKVKEAWPNETTNVVTVWATAEGTLRDEVVEEVDERAVRREYMFVLTVDANNKVEKVVEFVDTESVKHVMRLAMSLQAHA